MIKLYASQQDSRQQLGGTAEKPGADHLVYVHQLNVQGDTLLLYQLNEVAALEGYNISWDNRVMLHHN